MLKQIRVFTSKNKKITCAGKNTLYVLSLFEILRPSTDADRYQIYSQIKVILLLPESCGD